MKNVFQIFTLLLVVVGAAGCKKDQDNINKPLIYTVQDYDKIELDGNVKLRIVGESSDYTGNTLRITSGAETADWVELESIGRVLYIRVDDNVQLEDGLTLTLVTRNAFIIDEIRLQSGHHSVINGSIFQNELNVVTEGNSTLHLSGFRVNELICRSEADSKITLNSYFQTFTSFQEYSENRVVQLNSNTLLVDGTYMVHGDAVTLTNGMWRVDGNNIIYQYRINQCNFKTEGSSGIYAANAPSKNIEIQLEGSSEAEVWSFDNITGKGEGTSRLYYVNQVGLNIAAFIIQGDAQILQLP